MSDESERESYHGHSDFDGAQTDDEFRTEKLLALNAADEEDTEDDDFSVYPYVEITQNGYDRKVYYRDSGYAGEYEIYLEGETVNPTGSSSSVGRSILTTSKRGSSRATAITERFERSLPS